MTPECPFCEEFNSSGFYNGKSRLIHHCNRYIVIPTIGCFCEGYCLYLPKEHRTSFAECSPEALETARDKLYDIRRIIAEEIGINVILAEHGPRSGGKGKSEGPDCSCVDHAHIHMIPVPDVGAVLHRYVEAGGPPTALGSFSEISQFKGPYIYLGIPSLTEGESRHMIWKDTKGFQRQFVRKVCASIYGMGSFYNWRRHPFQERMRETYNRLKPHFSGHKKEFTDRLSNPFQKHKRSE
jgi:diadenosine tetraphosphate (Ap4A) HIT family hydrolase